MEDHRESYIIEKFGLLYAGGMSSGELLDVALSQSDAAQSASRFHVSKALTDNRNCGSSRSGVDKRGVRWKAKVRRSIFLLSSRIHCLTIPISGLPEPSRKYCHKYLVNQGTGNGHCMHDYKV